MKKQIALFIITLMLVVILAACSSARSSAEQAPLDPPPAIYFDTVEEAVERIKEVKAIGPGETISPFDFKIHNNKEQLYVLKECPLPGFIYDRFVLEYRGTRIIYIETSTQKTADFMWCSGEVKDKRLPGFIEYSNCKQYMDTEYYYYESHGDIVIVWWEENIEFHFSYPADIDIPLEDVIEHIEVEKIDL